MTIEAKIVCDSVGPNGIRLTTFVLKYPRFLHAEILTHRAFSRNASSSRAIPFKRQMQMIKEDMAMPLNFRANRPGMQAGEPLSPIKQKLSEATWRLSGHVAIFFAKTLNALGAHKQYVNRLVEPHSHISVVLSATEFANFFALRYHSMAQPEIAELAKQMYKLYSTNKPKELKEGDWHLPFVTDEERREQALISFAGKEELSEEEIYEDYWLPLIKRSVARCARVSYLNHDGGKATYEQDCKLFDRLLKAAPKHASPAEHQAKCLPWVDDLWYANFHGWEQFRGSIEDENITEFKEPLDV